MRMWGVNPKLMCRQHLLGEHVEMHMFVGTLKKGVSVAGYTSTQLVDLAKLNERHDELVQEMLRRGMNHRSPLARVSLSKQQDRGSLNVEANLIELARRCLACRQQQQSK